MNIRKSIIVTVVAMTVFAWQMRPEGVRAQEAVPPQEVDFTVPDVDGKPFTLSTYRGRWVVVNYWATWCTPCLREIPELAWFHDKYKTRAVVVGLNFEAISKASLRKFIAKHEMTYPVVLMGVDPLPFEPLIGLPSTFFISPEGEYVARHIGPITARDIERFIKANT